jgi:hypothetical protein
MPETTFTVTEDHLILLRNAYVDWDDMEFGAPRIDPKRPYGNSSVISDIARLLYPDVVAELDDEAAEDWLDEHEDSLTQIHRETQTVLQIAIATGEFRAGTYVREAYGSQWVRQDALPGQSDASEPGA